MSKGKHIGYIRVSSVDQNIARQQAELEQFQLDKTFIERASGKNITERPQLQAMLDYVREDDEIFVLSMDRLARNLEDLLHLMKQLEAKGVTIRFLKENLRFVPGSEDSISKMLLTIMGAVAEFERALIRERQREGIAQAKLRGAYTGRKPIAQEKVDEALRLVQEKGLSKRSVAKQLGISRSTLYRYLPRKTEGQ